jgi:hypothetical protein
VSGCELYRSIGRDEGAAAEGIRSPVICGGATSGLSESGRLWNRIGFDEVLAPEAGAFDDNDLGMVQKAIQKR